jgi:Asp-tRNA(Asn)/Glu-tRNA(Gln) amidotransferase C subunit
VGVSLARADMLANAPDRSGDFFRVPRIIEE